MIDLFPNSTFFVQLAIFFAVLLVLSKGLFRPVLALCEARKEKSTGSMDKIARFEKILTEKTLAYEKGLQEARAEAMQLKDKLRHEAASEEKAIIEAARAESERTLAKIRSELEQDVTQAKISLKQEAQSLAASMVKKIVGSRIAAVVVIALAFGAASSQAFAAEAVAEEGPTLSLVFQWVNFAILVVGLVVLLKRPVQAFFAKRSSEIAYALSEAERARKAIEQRARELEARLSGLDREVKAIKDSIVSTAALEKKTIVERAAALAQKTRDDIAVIADQELKKAREDLKQFAIELALETARHEIVRTLDGKNEGVFDRAIVGGLRGVL